MKRSIVLALMLTTLTVGMVSCGVRDSGVKPEHHNTTEIAEEASDSFSSGVYTTKDYTLSIEDSGKVEKDRVMVRYTLENTSDVPVKPDTIWGYTLKVKQGNQPITFGRLNNQDNILATEVETSTLHEEVASGGSVNGAIILEVPDTLSDVPVVVTALDTKTNKSLGEYELQKDDLTLDVTHKGTIKKASEEEPEVEITQVEEEKTGADEALEETEQDKIEDKLN